MGFEFLDDRLHQLLGPGVHLLQGVHLDIHKEQEVIPSKVRHFGYDFGQRMTDPFTMFKVFRRDVLFGIDFICKRFDFDHEMVIKFIRKGYQPLELPVNYRARSFAEGKKVSFIKDGLFWITTDLKLRFGRLGRWSQ